MNSYPSSQARHDYSDRLGQSLSEGYISLNEYADRLAVIWNAETQAQLDYVFRDLPEPMIPTTDVTVRIDHVRRKFTWRTFALGYRWPLFWLIFNSAYLSWSAVTGKAVLMAFYGMATAFWLVMTVRAVSARLPRKIRY